MLESMLKHTQQNGKSGDSLTDMLSSLLSGQNAKVTIKIEAGKERNQRNEAGDMQSEPLSNGMTPSLLDFLNESSGGLFGQESGPMGGGLSNRTNRSPYGSDILAGLLGGGGGKPQIPIEMLLALAAKANPFAGSVGAPTAGVGASPEGMNAMLAQLLGGGAGGTVGMPSAAPPSMPSPYMEGMPNAPMGAMPPGMSPGIPEVMPQGLPPEAGAGNVNMEEILKKLMAGR